MRNTRKLMQKHIAIIALSFLLSMCMGIMPVFAEDEGTDAIAITVVIPPLPERPATATEARRLFPVNVAEGYNYEGVRQLVRVYELLPDERPEWINTDSFERNGYYYRIADIIRRVDVSHTVREHTETIEIHTERNDLAAVIAGLDQTIEFVDEDGYAGMLHLDIRSIEMTQDGTRSTSRTVSQTREYPHMSNPDISLLPQTITANGRTYTLANVNWQTNTSTAIDYSSVAQTFTAHATYTRTATSTVSTGYTTRAEYSGTLTRVSTGDTRFVATFIGTPIVGLIVNSPAGTPPSAPEQGQAADGDGTSGSNNEESHGQSATPAYTPENNVAGSNYSETTNGSNGQPTAGDAGTAMPPEDDGQNGASESRNMTNLLITLGFLLALAVIAALIAALLRNRKKEALLEEELREAYAGYSDFADYAGGPGKTSRPRPKREPKSWEKADALRSRMETILDRDRRELGRNVGGRYVKNYHTASALDADADYDEDFSDSTGHFVDGRDTDFDSVEVDEDWDEEAGFHDPETDAFIPCMETGTDKDKRDSGRHGDGRLVKNFRSKAGIEGETAFRDATFGSTETNDEIPDDGLPDNNFDYETAAREATKKLLKAGDEDG